jgi:hypothetical protein
MSATAFEFNEGIMEADSGNIVATIQHHDNSV